MKKEKITKDHSLHFAFWSILNLDTRIVSRHFSNRSPDRRFIYAVYLTVESNCAHNSRKFNQSVCQEYISNPIRSIKLVTHSSSLCESCMKAHTEYDSAQNCTTIQAGWQSTVLAHCSARYVLVLEILRPLAHKKNLEILANHILSRKVKYALFGAPSQILPPQPTDRRGSTLQFDAKK